VGDESADPGDLAELGLSAERRYRVTLTARQWRLILEVLDGVDEGAATFLDSSGRLGELHDAVGKQVRGARSEVTLSGDDWASLSSELAGVAYAYDEMVADGEETDDGGAYWALLDRISGQLGGPRHPNLGYER
jgi:hypothetical protein